MKDTIYIDVEDDITAIIGKVKAAKNKVVALVPPKRTGVLQSAVNLRLLARAAKQNDKHLVLISGNSALTALAASAGIPSARTLQSKPEMAPVPENEEDEGEDIIDGSELPIGDLERTAENGEGGALAGAAVSSAILANAAEEVPEKIAASPIRTPSGTPTRSKVKIPNFDTFRKKMALIITAVVLLGGFLVWAIFFAPHAKIIITARTIESSANPKVTLASNLKTDVGAGTIRATDQRLAKDASLTFDATGKKDVGDKATGTVVFQLCGGFSPPSDIPAGTTITSGNNSFVTGKAASFTAGSIGNGCINYKSNSVDITATKPGSDHNMSNATFQVSGSSAVGTGTATGGTDKTVAVVTQDDVDKATDQFSSQMTDGAKKDIIAAFGSDVVTIDSSFYIDKTTLGASPAVNAEAPDGKAKLTGQLVFTMIGVSKSEAGSFLDAYFQKQLDNTKNQRVYSNGVDKMNFVDVQRTDKGSYTATMAATAKLGPKINDDDIKAGAAGKRYGEVQSSLEQISGVESVDVKFSPFWVNSVPKDQKRISIEFKLDESK